MRLQQFSIVNSKLDSVNALVINELNTKERQKNEAMVLELNLVNDTIEFIYSFHDRKEEISSKFISLYNKRILGYTDKGNKEIILLSNIDNYYELIKCLKPFIKPNGEYKTFEYIYYNPEQYSNWDDAILYEPLRWHFKYYNGEIIFQNGRLE